MFDQTYVRQEVAPAYPQHIHLAPTAEHLRLLNEMREQVRKEVESTLTVQNTVFGEIVTYEDISTQKIKILFSVNGTRFSGEVDTKEMVLNGVLNTLSHFFVQTCLRQQEVTKPSAKSL